MIYTRHTYLSLLLKINWMYIDESFDEKLMHRRVFLCDRPWKTEKMAPEPDLACSPSLPPPTPSQIMCG